MSAPSPAELSPPPLPRGVSVKLTVTFAAFLAVLPILVFVVWLNVKAKDSGEAERAWQVRRTQAMGEVRDWVMVEWMTAVQKDAEGADPSALLPEIRSALPAVATAAAVPDLAIYWNTAGEDRPRLSLVGSIGATPTASDSELQEAYRGTAPKIVKAPPASGKDPDRRAVTMPLFPRGRRSAVAWYTVNSHEWSALRNIEIVHHLTQAIDVAIARRMLTGGRVSDFEPVRVALAAGVEGLKERLRSPGVAIYWIYSEQDDIRRFWSGGPAIPGAGLSAIARAGSAPELPPARVREVVLTGELPPDDSPSVAIVPIRMGDTIPAVAWVEIPAPPAEGTAGQAFLYVALGAMALVLGFLFFYMNQRVSQPLQNLIGAMGRGTEGDLEPIAEGAGSGEVSWLAGSFNRLVGKLKVSDNQNRELLNRIQRFNEELKVKVAQATRELERRNEELRRSNDRLFTLQRELSQHERLATLGQLAGNMAHELGTPLNAMSGHVELMLSEEEALGPDVAKRLKLIGGQIDRLSTIIQQTLHQLRAPAPRFASVDLNGLVSGIATLVQPTVANRQIALRSSLAPSLPPVAGDPEQLEQVLMNLVNNAVDAMPSGGSLDLITALQEGQVVLQVRDSGAGISKEDIGRVFEPFYSTKKAGRGTGLGLAICRSIVKSHNGTIDVQSDAGKGAWFTVKLPAAEKLAGGAGAAAPVPVPSR